MNNYHKVPFECEDFGWTNKFYRVYYLSFEVLWAIIYLIVKVTYFETPETFIHTLSFCQACFDVAVIAFIDNYSRIVLAESIS